ncbi:MAG: DUF4252 domain-containing protein [Bacteroidales bacterium]|nr:DUF4252 domain-containing protein [Bacteroidales bacterium]
MKKIALILAVIALSVSALAQDGKSIYNKYSNEEGVSAVYISPAMFKLIGKIPEIKVEEDGVDLSPIIQSLTGMYILSSDNPKMCAQLRDEASKFVKSKKYELLMEAKEAGEAVKMYTIGNDKTVNGLVLLASEKDEVSFICLDGKMDRKQFEETLAAMAK